MRSTYTKYITYAQNDKHPQSIRQFQIQTNHNKLFDDALIETEKIHLF